MDKHTADTDKCKALGPVKIAVTGGIGSGKSVVCTMLAEKGLPVVSADELSRRAVEPGTTAYGQIVEYFGESVLLPDGNIDRPALRNVISSDGKAKRALEGFVHPEVFRQMEKRMEEAAQKESAAVVMEVPLLFESGMEKWFDCVVMVFTPEEDRIRRIMARDGVLREEARSMMKIQMPEEMKQKHAQLVIDNDGPMEETRRSVDRLHRRIMEKAGANIRKKCKNG